MGHGDFNYKLGPTYGQSIPKLAVGPSCFTITDPHIGPVSLQITSMASNMILGNYNHRVPSTGGRQNGYWVIIINNYGQRMVK